MKPDQPTDRPRQDTPEDLVNRLLDFVRHHFYGDATAKKWAQDSNFIRRYVILWPARFINSHGFTLPAARYQAIMLEVLMDVVRKGNTATVKYWPGYLTHCVQEHWHHHWEEYYGEAKSMRAKVEALLLRCKPVPREDQTVEALALAHQVLTAKRRKGQQPAARSPQKQLPLFGL
jgi:hypothetical protein